MTRRRSSHIVPYEVEPVYLVPCTVCTRNYWHLAHHGLTEQPFYAAHDFIPKVGE